MIERRWEYIRMARLLTSMGYKFRTARGFKGWWFGTGPDSFYAGPSVPGAYKFAIQRADAAKQSPNYMYGWEVAFMLGSL
jgi:hypothetical protein